MRNRLIAMSDREITVEVVPARVRGEETPFARGDASQAKNLLGWQPDVSLEETLRSVLAFRGNSVAGGRGALDHPFNVNAQGPTVRRSKFSSRTPFFSCQQQLALAFLQSALRSTYGNTELSLRAFTMYGQRRATRRMVVDQERPAYIVECIR